jgi:GntR family transcriptional regulator
MQFHVNPGDGLPIYRQIMRQVIDAIAGGRLAVGSQLPSHRELAQTLVVAPLTVKKAYDELERAGYVRMQRGQGSFVTGGPELDAAARLERLRPQVQRLVSDAAVLGAGQRDLIGLVSQEAKRLREGDRGDPPGEPNEGTTGSPRGRSTKGGEGA